MIFPDSTSSSAPGSKKRCWTLLFKDIKNNVKEAEVMSSFRKRYTSVRKLAFRSSAPYIMDADADAALCPSASNTSGDGLPGKTTLGRSLCVEVQFTGPQPVEGPVGLMCNLLQGTFVAANPVQLGRGRKRKIRSGGSHMNPRAFSCNCAAGGNAGKREEHAVAAAATDGGRNTCGTGSGRYSFDFRVGPSAGGAAGAAAETKAPGVEAVRSTAQHDESESPGFCDAMGGMGSARPFARSASSTSTASTASMTSNVDDRLDGHLEDRSDGDGASYPRKRPYSPSVLQERPSNGGTGGDVHREVFAAAAAFEGANLDVGSSAAAASVAGTTIPAAAAAVDDRGADGGDARATSRLARSCSVMTAAGEDLPKWDEVIRRAATTSSASEATDASASSPPESSPSLVTGRSFYECKGKVMSQEEVASLFAGDATPPLAAAVAAAGNDGAAAPDTAAEAVVAAAAATAAATASAAATAAGGVVVSEDGLWAGAPDEADTLFAVPPLGRHSSASWALYSVHAEATAVVANDEDDDDVGDDADAGGSRDRFTMNSLGRHQATAAAAAAAASAQRQRQGRPSEGYGGVAGLTHAAVAAMNGVRLTPVGNEISLSSFEEGCDFDGHPGAGLQSTAADTVPPAIASPSTTPLSPPFPVEASHRREGFQPCRLSFSGLRSAAARGHDPRDLSVSAQFCINPKAAVEREAGPLEVDAATGNDQATAAVAYPSIWEVWPEVYTMTHIRAVEVEMIVRIRSRSSGEVVYTGPTLKITYWRPSTREHVGTIGEAPPGIPRTISLCSSPPAGGQDPGFGGTV